MAIKAADQITITDITDAYSVILTSEAFTFVGGTGGAASGSTCSTDAVAYCGTNQCTNVSVTQSAIKFYDASGTEVTSGISATVTNSGTSKVTITFSLSATLANALEADIPVVVDGITVHKKFSLAVAKTGQQGQQGNAGRGISSTVIEYQSSTGNTTPPTGTWSTTIPSVAAGSYLWTRTTVNYTSGDPSISYSVAKQGSTGTTGSQWYSGTGITGTSTTPTIFSGSGVASARVNDMYLNTDTGNTYICTTAGAANILEILKVFLEILVMEYLEQLYNMLQVHLILQHRLVDGKILHHQLLLVLIYGQKQYLIILTEHQVIHNILLLNRVLQEIQVLTL